jgi:hypothetical protein
MSSDAGVLSGAVGLVMATLARKYIGCCGTFLTVSKT